MRIRRRKLIRIAAVGLITSVLVAGMSALGYLDVLQLRVLDFMIWWRPVERPEAVVIVAIDEEAFRLLGERQPLPRENLAALLRLLDACGPRAIGLDIDLSSPTQPDEDRELLRAVEGKVVVPFELLVAPQAGAFQTVPVFTGVIPADAGFANTYQDSDGVVRRMPPVLQDETGNVLSSFGFEVYRAAARQEGRNIPLERYTGTELRIRYAGPAGTFSMIPAGPLFRLAEEGIPPPEDNPFRNKVVLVGATFRAGRDIVLTPKGAMSGVEVHANIVNTLVTGGGLRAFPWGASLLLQILIASASCILFLTFRPGKAALLSITVIVIIFVPLSFAVLQRGNYWIDLVTPFVAVAGASLTNDIIERRRVRKAFRQYVSGDVLKQLADDEGVLEGQKRAVSVLFADIRGFTALSEELPLEQLIPLLNEYLASMTDAVHRHGGMINKFIGDAVMAIFGAPIARADHAHAAVSAALDMVEALGILNGRITQRGFRPFRIGVGIHTGEVFAGNVGSEARKEYTIVGDVVNVASRIETMNKELATSVLISEDTHAAAKEKVETIDRGLFHLRGKQHPIRLFELVAEKKGGTS